MTCIGFMCFNNLKAHEDGWLPPENPTWFRNLFHRSIQFATYFYEFTSLLQNYSKLVDEHTIRIFSLNNFLNPHPLISLGPKYGLAGY